ncbi:MAG TPA: hypothetical protein VFB38_03635 [Chthonomonadaceae bacterium]|nr:hypothetical protein [Chthonomonadaceae bacterium]
MVPSRTLLISLLLCCFPLIARGSAPRPTLWHEDTPDTPTVAVTDFAGTDRELGHFLAETLLTDLNRSDRLHVVEPAEVQQALQDLELPPAGLLEPPQARRLGREVGADRLLVGSYLARDGRLLVNARLLEVQTGHTVPGGAANVSGDRQDILALAHRLANQIHQRLTGAELVLDAPQAPTKPPAEADDPPASPQEEEQESLEPLQQSGLIPERARPDGIVRERDLMELVGRVARRLGSRTRHAVSATQPRMPVSRVRALTALVKVALSPEDLAAYRTAPNEEEMPAARQVPLWGRPYFTAAVAQGWWPAEQPLRARETATWGFVASLLAKMPLEEADPTAPPLPREVPEPAPEPENYTGLVIDARDLPLQRTMGPRILDENGRAVYPDPTHVPDFDFLQDRGMASYDEDLGSARRAGSHPLIVRALDVAGPGHDDVVISNEAAQRIRETNRQCGFLRRWAVCILVTPQR